MWTGICGRNRSRLHCFLWWCSRGLTATLTSPQNRATRISMRVYTRATLCRSWCWLHRMNKPLVDGHVPEEFMQSLRRYIRQVNSVTFVSERTAEHGPEHRVARYQHIFVCRKCNTVAICWECHKCYITSHLVGRNETIITCNAKKKAHVNRWQKIMITFRDERYLSFKDMSVFQRLTVGCHFCHNS